MKKTRLLLSMLVGQSIVVLCLQHYLLAAVPIHYGLMTVAWNDLPAHNLEVALIASILIPIILLATQALSFTNVMPVTYSWRLQLKTCWFWWLFGLNWLVLISLFVNATWLNWIMLLWTLMSLIASFKVYSTLMRTANQK